MLLLLESSNLEHSALLLSDISQKTQIVVVLLPLVLNAFQVASAFAHACFALRASTRAHSACTFLGSRPSRAVVCVYAC